MCQFKLTVHMNEADVHLKPTSYVQLTEIKKVLIKFLKNKGKPIKVNNPSIYCSNYQDNCGSILFAENRVSNSLHNTTNLLMNVFLECI